MAPCTALAAAGMQEQKQQYFDIAKPFEGNPVIGRFSALAKELGVVIPGESTNGPCLGGRTGSAMLC